MVLSSVGGVPKSSLHREHPAGAVSQCKYPQTGALEGLLPALESQNETSGTGNYTHKHMLFSNRCTFVYMTVRTCVSIYCHVTIIEHFLLLQEAELERCRHLQVLIKLVRVYYT